MIFLGNKFRSRLAKTSFKDCTPVALVVDIVVSFGVDSENVTFVTLEG